MGSQETTETIAGLRIFLFRVAAVFVVFLGANGASTVGPNGVISNFFVDGPLALATSMAESLSNNTARVLASGLGQSNSALFGTYGGPGGVGSGGDMGSYAQAHVMAATTMLNNMHQMGIVGIVMALWMGLMDPNVSVQTPQLAIVSEGAALFMLYTFFMFTLTFGLRYMDALIRSMLTFRLTPVFLFLWIFDATRGMAVQAMRSGLALAAIFAVSGVVFTVAYFILQLGFANAFNNQGQNFAGLSAALCAMNNSDVANLMGTQSQGSSLNWMTYFYLTGSAALATACATLTFELATQIFDFKGSDLGVAKAVSEDMQAGLRTTLKGIRGL